MAHFSNQNIVAGVNEIVHVAKKEKPKSDQLDANGDQVWRADAAGLVLDEEAWLASLHSLQGRDLPSHLIGGSQPSDHAPSRARHGEPDREAAQETARNPAQVATDADDDWRLDNRAWTRYLHSLGPSETAEEGTVRRLAANGGFL